MNKDKYVWLLESNEADELVRAQLHSVKINNNFVPVDLSVTEEQDFWIHEDQSIIDVKSNNNKYFDLLINLNNCVLLQIQSCNIRIACPECSEHLIKEPSYYEEDLRFYKNKIAKILNGLEEVPICEDCNL